MASRLRQVCLIAVSFFSAGVIITVNSFLMSGTASGTSTGKATSGSSSGSSGTENNNMLVALPAAGSDSDNDESEGNDQVGSLPLPRLSKTDPNKKVRTLQLGETIQLKEMGPIILNSDGTTKRISNWDQMTEQEQAKAWERISKRNEQRREKIIAQREAEEQGEL